MTAATKKKAETALITGASSGIGEALAACFAKDGFDLVLVARSTGKLEALAAELASTHGIHARVQPADLAQPGAAEELAAALRRKKLPIDILVNNAGVLEHGAFVAMPPQRHQELISLNVAGLTAMLAHFVPPMVERGRGRILNVASIAAFQPVPSLATYAATKAYVLSLTESLAEELKGTGVTITALCPGITATGMISTVQATNATMAQMPGFLVGDAATVAAEGYAACMKGEVIRVPGVVNQALVLASRASPKWLLRSVYGSVGRRTIKG
jgi:uncharacterized protein